MDPVINLTNVLVSEFEKIDNRLDQMLENVDDLMARDLQSPRTRGIRVWRWTQIDQVDPW